MSLSWYGHERRRKLKWIAIALAVVLPPVLFITATYMSVASYSSRVLLWKHVLVGTTFSRAEQYLSDQGWKESTKAQPHSFPNPDVPYHSYKTYSRFPPAIARIYVDGAGKVVAVQTRKSALRGHPQSPPKS